MLQHNAKQRRRNLAASLGQVKLRSEESPCRWPNAPVSWPNDNRKCCHTLLQTASFTHKGDPPPLLLLSFKKPGSTSFPSLVKLLKPLYTPHYESLHSQGLPMTKLSLDNIHNQHTSLLTPPLLLNGDHTVIFKANIKVFQHQLFSITTQWNLHMLSLGWAETSHNKGHNSSIYYWPRQVPINYMAF